WTRTYQALASRERSAVPSAIDGPLWTEDSRFEEGDHPVERHGGGVDDDGVVGRPHRGDRPGGVAGVAVEEVAEDVLEAERSARLGVLLVPPTGALLGAGGEEELAEGVGEDDRPLVAALGDRVVLGGE